MAVACKTKDFTKIASKSTAIFLSVVASVGIPIATTVCGLGRCCVHISNDEICQLCIRFSALICNEHCPGIFENQEQRHCKTNRNTTAVLYSHLLVLFCDKHHRELDLGLETEGDCVQEKEARLSSSLERVKQGMTVWSSTSLPTPRRTF